jgi:hypothetical protein
MATIVNADTSTGGAIITGDASGQLELQAAGVTKLTVNSSGTTLATPLAVSSGGTGVTTLAVNNVLLGNNSSAIQAIAPGTSGNVLTSTGTTWASTPVVASGTYSATASGNITAGLGVIVNSNSTVSNPVLTRAITSAAAVTTATNLPTNNQEYCELVYVGSLNIFIAIYNRLTDQYLCAKIGTSTSAGVLSWGSEIVLSSTAVKQINAIWSPSNSKLYVAVLTTANTASVLAATVTATTITPGTLLSMWGTGGGYPSITFDSTANILFFIAGDGPTGRMAYATVSVSGITLTNNGQVLWPAGQNPANPNAFYWPALGKVVVFVRNTTTQYLSGFIVTITGTTPLAAAMQQLTTDGQPATYRNGFAVPSNTSTSAMITFYRPSVSSMGSGIVSFSGSTLTMGTTYTVTGTASNSNGMSLVYDPSVNAYISAYGDRTTPFYVKSQIATVSGTVITWGSNSTIIPQAVGSVINSVKNVVDTTLSRVVTIASTGSTGAGAYSSSQVNGSTTLTANNFIGVATASVLSGASATTTIFGGVNTAASGLTAGQGYYCVGDGTFTTSSSAPAGLTSGVKVGVALSATSILVGQ